MPQSDFVRPPILIGVKSERRELLFVHHLVVFDDILLLRQLPHGFIIVYDEGSGVIGCIALLLHNDAILHQKGCILIEDCKGLNLYVIPTHLRSLLLVRLLFSGVLTYHTHCKLAKLEASGRMHLISLRIFYVDHFVHVVSQFFNTATTILALNRTLAIFDCIVHIIS